MLHAASRPFDSPLENTPHNAEDFKQGATSAEPALSTDLTAPCLKFRCAKPLEDTLEAYVF
jgi:hypothetical protein